MKKNFRIVLALVLALSMVLGMVPAMADGDTNTNPGTGALIGDFGLENGNDNGAGNVGSANDPAGVGPYEHTDTINVTVNDYDHSANFYAIQIFGGSQTIGTSSTAQYHEVATANGDNNNLGDIVWGADVAGYESQIIAAVNTAFGTTLRTVDDANDNTLKQATAKEVAEAIATSVNGTATGINAEDDAKAKDLAQLLGRIFASTNIGTKLTSNTNNEVPIGYYLVVDRSTLNITDPNKPDALNASLLQFTRDITIKKKTDAPHIEKKILDDKNDDGALELVDSNTATIGDEITFQVEGTIPDVTYYDYFYYVLKDTLSGGLTFQNNIVVYKAEPVKDAQGNITYPTEVALTANTDYKVYTGDDVEPNTFWVSFINIKNAQSTDTAVRGDLTALPAGTKIFVRYTALLNSSAVIGGTGNPNEITLTYSNNPDKSEQHDVTGKPGIPDQDENTVTGVTPPDKTITYTAEVKLTKKAQTANGTALEGAEFTLTGTLKKPVVKTVTSYVASSGDAATWYRLQNGTYTETAPTKDSMTEKIGSNITSGYVVDNNYTDMDRVEIVDDQGNKTVYRPYVAATDSGKTVYKLTKGTEDLYANTTQKYEQKAVTQTTFNEVPVQFIGVSGPDGIIEFEDLGIGTYTLEETVVPDGYNKADIVKIQIDATLPTEVTTGNEKATWSIGTDSTNGAFALGDDETIGIYETTVVDTMGATLPETGGVGTTIFYIAGSLMVLAAAILLITKRRMGAED